MEQNLSEMQQEEKKLAETIALATKQLLQAQENNEKTKSAIITAKKDLRENTVHSFGNLCDSDSFEALIEMNQYMDPVTTKLADFETTQRKITLLENMIKSPYFARVDFKFQGDEDCEKIYIGRSSLMKDNSYEPCVYDWRSPIASLFYRFVTGPAFFDAPNGRVEGHINLKRQYEISQGILEYYFDSDMQIVDEFLRKLLSQNTSPKMKTIVETIQREQDLVIRDMETSLMMVQGVAGSGKTSIALHRAAYLMYQGLSSRLNANNILILSPNTLFEQYISNVLPELGEENVVSLVYEEMLSSILPYQNIQTRNEFLEKLISSPINQSIIKRSIEFKTSPLFLQILTDFLSDFPSKWIEFEDVFYGPHFIVDRKTLKKKIVSRRLETPLGIKLSQLEDYIMERLRDCEQGKITKEEIDLFRSQKLKFTKLNIRGLYRRLMSDKSYFYSLCTKYTLPDCIEDILDYTIENLNTSILAYEDATVIAYLTLKINGTSLYKNIKQVVIDEAQDYYPLHFEIFNMLFTNSKFTVLGDINQTLEKGEDLSLYENIREILKKPTSTLVTMDKSFRCTNEILNFSSYFIPNSINVISFNRKGTVPQINTADTQAVYKEQLLAEIQLCLNEGYKSIGMICKTQIRANAIYDLLCKEISLQIIGAESNVDLNGIIVLPVYMSKGLEFDAVLVCDCEKNSYYSEDDKKLLYIASTRALHRLNLFSLGDVSSLLPSLD